MTQIQNIIFDVGRVLVDFQEPEVVAELLPDSPHIEFYAKEFLMSELWLSLDHGTLDADGVAEALRPKFPDHAGLAEDIKHIIKNFVPILPLMEDSKILFEDLAEKYPIYILSNFQDKPFDLLLETHPFIKKAKGMVASAKVKAMKPDARIYEILFETYDLTPETCIFLDDKLENVEAGKKLGMPGIVFQNAAQARKDLAAMGVFL